jgi:hypothetical protein
MRAFLLGLPGRSGAIGVRLWSIEMRCLFHYSASPGWRASFKAIALPVWPVTGLAQVQEPRGPRSEA